MLLHAGTVGQLPEASTVAAHEVDVVVGPLPRECRARLHHAVEHQRARHGRSREGRRGARAGGGRCAAEPSARPAPGPAAVNGPVDPVHRPQPEEVRPAGDDEGSAGAGWDDRAAGRVDDRHVLSRVEARHERRESPARGARHPRPRAPESQGVLAVATAEQVPGLIAVVVQIHARLPIPRTPHADGGAAPGRPEPHVREVDVSLGGARAEVRPGGPAVIGAGQAVPVGSQVLRVDRGGERLDVDPVGLARGGGQPRPAGGGLRPLVDPVGHPRVQDGRVARVHDERADDHVGARSRAQADRRGSGGVGRGCRRP